MITKSKIDSWINRTKLEKHEEYAENKNKSILVKTKKEKLYDYYICDYCRMPIKFYPNQKSYEAEGGKAILPNSLTNKGNIPIMAHNRCIKPLIQEVEQILLGGKVIRDVEIAENIHFAEIQEELQKYNANNFKREE